VTVVAGSTPDVVGTAGTSGGSAGSPRERRRQWVWGGAAGGVVVLTALAAALAVPPTSRGDLEPTSAAPQGARAVVEILRRQGVSVETVRRSTDAAAAATAGTTLVVVFPELLGPEQLDRLAVTPARLVVVGADLPALERLAPFARVAGVEEARVAEPGCDDPAATAAGPARAGGSQYRLAPADGSDGSSTGRPAVLCYPADGSRDRGSLVVGRAGGRDVVLLGQADVLRNEHLAAANGTAALALRLLGASDRLVWYLPDPGELAQSKDAPTLTELLPRWVPWVGVQLVLAVAVAMLWRGRRLGRLVPEPLPVVVRAAETQEGRARLYRRAGAHARAGATLRTAALRRVARRLDVPVDASPDVVVALAAQATGLSHPAVHSAFLGPAPTDDRGLVRLADDLATVEAAMTSAPQHPSSTSAGSTSASSTPPSSTSPEGFPSR